MRSRVGSRSARAGAASLGLLALIACAGGPGRDTTPAPAADVPEQVAAPVASPGKAGAPVEVRSEVTDGRVRLEIAFASAGSDVRVELRGTDGLVVQGETVPVQGRSVAAGQTLRLEVAVAPGEPHSNLGVLVSGVFGGVRRARAASVTVGERARPRTEALGRDDGSGLKVAGQGEIR